MKIDVYSDVVCPWCFIGKRQLDAALAQHEASGNPRPRVAWRAFQLNPHLPQEGMARADYVRQKFGASRSGDVYARVAAVGAQHDIDFAFDAIARQPNTLDAHRLIALAGAEDARRDASGSFQSSVKEALMRAFFIDGIDLTRRENLIAIGASAGLDRNAAEHWLDDPETRRAVELEDRRARMMGVQGVPLFIFDDTLAVSGAQGAPALLEAMRRSQKSDLGTDVTTPSTR